ncbi:MAG: type II toxin-antitoxin system Phd/YefM family antitoxin [Acidobacteriota bacterium]|nr:type II toxin-antitoxin system Phd/YefM family antitoxin [Acidobacteriota bacterium]
MTNVSITDARARLYALVDQASEESEPILITGKRNNAVLVSEDDWRSIQETLYLLSIPGMRESIREGMNEPIDQTSEEPGW